MRQFYVAGDVDVRIKGDRAMTQSYFISAVIILLSITTYSNPRKLSVDNLLSAQMTLGFDRTIQLNESNQFRFPIVIDGKNKCTLTPLTTYKRKEVSINRGTEWKTEPSRSWNDWDEKKISFKLVHRQRILLLNCDLNLEGKTRMTQARFMSAFERSKIKISLEIPVEDTVGFN